MTNLEGTERSTSNMRTTHTGRPIHPAAICIPLGAFLMALLGDIATAATHDPFWFQWSYRCISIGLFFAIVAAIPGIMEYLFMKMRDFGAELATTQASLIVGAVGMYAVDLYLRGDAAPFDTSRLAQLMTLESVGLATMGIAVWIGSQMESIRRIQARDNVAPVERRRQTRQFPQHGLVGH